MNVSFEILYSFFLQNLYVSKGDGITITNCKSSEAKVFADDTFLVKSLNSIVGLSYVLLNYDDVGIDRIGSQVLENFFGSIRYKCQNYDCWERILTAISHRIIRNKIFNKYRVFEKSLFSHLIKKKNLKIYN